MNEITLGATLGRHQPCPAWVLGMLYQTGYLTIDSYEDGLYKLRVPDEDVRRDVAALIAGAIEIRAGTRDFAD